MRVWAWMVFLLASVALCAPVRAQSDTPSLAQDGDYEATHKGWNGLSTWAALAAGEGLQVLESKHVDWAELDSNDVVVLIYPTNFVDPAAVVSFIRNGGRVLIADDFGTGDEILADLGGRRSPQFRAERYQDDQVFAPIATPAGTHPLSAGVVSLTTNHPAAIKIAGAMESIFEFASGESVVAAGELGLGRYVALADPSVLINRMLQFEGNLQFSINLLRYLIRPRESDRFIVLTGPVTLAGQPRNRYDDGTFRGSVSANVARVNGFIDGLNEWLFTAKYLKLLSVLAAFALAGLLYLAAPKSRHKPLDGSWTRAAAGPGPAPIPGTLPVGSVLASHATRGSRASYLLPAAIARDNVNAALELATRSPDPLNHLDEKELVELVDSHCGTAAARELRELLPRLRHIPQRAQAAAHWQPRHVSLREFQTLHDQAERLFKTLKAIPS